MTEKMIDKLKENGFTDEQIEFIDENVAKEIINRDGLKIRCEREYTLYRQVWGENVFYKIITQKKDKDGKNMNGYKRVRFYGCEPPKVDKCKIIIHKMFEDFWYKSSDKYDAFFSICILDYECVRNEAREKYEAIGDYYDAKEDDNYDNFNFGNPVNEIDDDLPF